MEELKAQLSRMEQAIQHWFTFYFCELTLFSDLSTSQKGLTDISETISVISSMFVSLRSDIAGISKQLDAMETSTNKLIQKSYIDDSHGLFFSLFMFLTIFFRYCWIVLV